MNDQSGGVNISGKSKVEVGGDVVGRDKITDSHDVTVRGDVINANVGAGAQDVAVGKFILQTNLRIGTLVIPARLVLALVGVVIVAAAVAWFVAVPEAMPPDTFNVAVAEFGQIGADGQMHSSDNGARLSAWMFGKLSEEAKNLNLDTQLTIWHHGSWPLQTRTMIGAVTDEADAAALARKLNAAMIIYGNLALNQDPATFTPQFYVAATRGEADELVGAQQLGAPIPLQLPIDFGQPRTDPYLNRFLKPRVTVLIYFTRGLGYDLSGDYATAYEIFRTAQAAFGGTDNTDGQDVTCVSSAPTDNAQGQDVVYYFIGREALFLARDESSARREFKSVEDALTSAENALKRAICIRSNYARAEFLLGNVYAARAQRLIKVPDVKPEDLDSARALLDQSVALDRKALVDAPQAPGSGVEFKAQISMGTAYLLQGTSFLVAGRYGDGVPFFETASGTMEKAFPLIPADDHRNRAQTLQARAAAYYEQAIAEQQSGNPARSKELYLLAQRDDNACIAEAAAQREDTFLQEVMSKHCKPDLDNVNKALASLDG